MSGVSATGNKVVDETEVMIGVDGNEQLAATLSVPTGASASPRPAILLCQGLSGVRNAVLPELAEIFAGSGFVTLRFDYLGCGDSDGEPGWVDPVSRSRQAGLALAWLIDRKEVDPSRVGAYGHSYGGQTAISVAAHDPRAAAVVAVSGPGSGSDLLRASRPGWDWIAFRKELEAERAAVASGAKPRLVSVAELLPFSPAFMEKWSKLVRDGAGTSAMDSKPELPSYFLLTADRMLEAEPAADAGQLGGRPVLMINGADDDVVPVETVEPVYRAVPGPKRWIRVPGADHNTLDAGEGLRAAGEQAAAWFEEHLREQ
ncbi:MAG: alpha/beta hydrolase [Solirubrobacterales bacterium]|nr:alpha/beta hydrolase [Solirubrobacterales bacterium]